MQEIDNQFDFFLFEKGKSIKVNGIDRIALVINVTNKPVYYDDKMLRCKEPLDTGDYVELNDSKYLVISQVDRNESSYRARIRKCGTRIAFNWNGNIRWFDCIEESSVFDVQTSQYMSLATGKINVLLPYNADTRNISLDQRFYVTNQAFKVTGIDRSQPGLIRLNCELDVINSTYDDVEGNIVDRWKYEITHTYTLVIDNGEDMSVQLNNIAQINCVVTDNGTVVENPVLTFSSSDSTCVSVDNTGELMGIAPGQAVVTAKMTYHDTVQDSIAVTCVENVSHNYTISITGITPIKVGQSKSYVCKFYDNGIEVFDKSATWTIRNQDNSTPLYATITGSTGNSATVKAGNQSGKSVVLKATLSDDVSVYAEFAIQINALF